MRSEARRLDTFLLRSEFSPDLVRQVAERAGYRCEYCHTPQAVTAQTFHVDHVMPRSRGGKTLLDNLCFACPRCNLHKSDQTTAVDHKTGRRAALFNPRRQDWRRHFRWSATYERLEARTASARATVSALDLNAPVLVEARRLWLVLGLIP